ncbi:MAG TPA: hypothetical protein GX507_07630 [Clostridia bacterium]|nr:hypothetical protein [Clostridia bacterium]
MCSGRQKRAAANGEAAGDPGGVREHGGVGEGGAEEPGRSRAILGVTGYGDREASEPEGAGSGTGSRTR